MKKLIKMQLSFGRVLSVGTECGTLNVAFNWSATYKCWIGASNILAQVSFFVGRGTKFVRVGL